MLRKYNLISIAALVVFAVFLPWYALKEPARMGRAQDRLLRQKVHEAADVYVENCGVCHGASGEGLGAMPPLNTLAMTQGDPEFLFLAIARAAHGTTMVAWHIDQGGILNDYEIEGLITLIRNPDWARVKALAVERDLAPSLPPPQGQWAYMAVEGEERLDPHQCISCHEEPRVHADLFGQNCARCHITEAWTPAMLTRHTFFLDHGGEGELACQACHLDNYYQHDCYQCHDQHQPDEMAQVHLAEDLQDYGNCVECHPTGQPDEARRIMTGGGEQLEWVGFSDLAGAP
jgi:mono/diheme cytochrome c family protein